MNILYCGDSKMKDGLLISILTEPVHVYILTAKLSNRGFVKDGGKDFEPLTRDYAQYLDGVVKESDSHNTVEYIDITDLFIANPPTANMRTRFTPYCMLRLYADLVEQIPSRVLYLDTDIICRKDFSEFYHQALGGHELAGVPDYYGSWFFKSDLKTIHRDYLNSGMLLLNLGLIRHTGLFARCRERCATKRMFMPDQSALNKLCGTKVISPRKFNEQRILHSNTVFQHFTTSFRFFPWLRTVTVKPWEIERVQNVLKIHEYDDIFDEYKEKTKEVQAL